MKRCNQALYESPHVDVLDIRMDSTLLTGSETGESFNNPVDYDLTVGDWNWII